VQHLAEVAADVLSKFNQLFTAASFRPQVFIEGLAASRLRRIRADTGL
jgi:hypothetical protein